MLHMHMTLNQIFELKYINNFTVEGNAEDGVTETEVRLLVHFWKRAKYELRTPLSTQYTLYLPL